MKHFKKFMINIPHTKSTLTTNILFSVSQVAVGGITLFFLYKYTLQFLGAEKFGIWSIVIASTSSLNIINTGFSGSLVKYVAKYSSSGDWKIIQALIETMFVTLAIAFGLLLTLSYPLFKELLAYLIISSSNLSESYNILPYCLLSFWLLILGGVFHSSLEGFNQVYLKNIILIFSSILTLITSIILVPSYGLIGLSYSYIISNFLSLVAGWYLVKKKIPLNSLFFLKWNKKIFKDTLRYSTSFQLISIATILNEPVTKSILTKYGGLEMTGLYEMASRLVIQLRALIVQANQSLVPVFANLIESDPLKVNVYYKTLYGYLFPISIFTFFSIIAMTPFISIIWIGELNIIFSNFVVFVSIGWLINTLTAPAYFVNIGTGKMKWNIICHVSMGIANLCLCTIIAITGGKSTIILGWIIALSICSAIITIRYHIENNISLKILLPSKSNYFFLITIFNTFFCYLLSFYLINKGFSKWLIYNSLNYFAIEFLLLRYYTTFKDISIFNKNRNIFEK